MTRLPSFIRVFRPICAACWGVTSEPLNAPKFRLDDLALARLAPNALYSWV